jgi:hypothetical protein
VGSNPATPTKSCSSEAVHHNLLINFAACTAEKYSCDTRPHRKRTCRVAAEDADMPARSAAIDLERAAESASRTRGWTSSPAAVTRIRAWRRSSDPANPDCGAS